LILYILTTSFFDSLAVSYMRNNVWDRSMWLSYLKVYFIITLAFGLVMLILLFVLKDMFLSLMLIYIIALIYLYFAWIYRISITNNSLGKNLMNGVRVIWKIHHTIIPLIMVLIAFVVGIYLSLLSSYLADGLVILFLIIFTVIIGSWADNYILKIYSYNKN
jgi:hypothetical protein